MASFNLGRIKGDKGDRGDTGPRGEQGVKGEKGDRGERGIDGLTPVFAVGETETVSSSEEAYVEINTLDPANPVLSFRIPRGKDGRDASGDMQSSVYDSKGVKEDFYEYAEKLLQKCLKISGGAMSGALKAVESDLSEFSVRNICVSDTLPLNAQNGDICIITGNKGAKKLGDCSQGDTILIEEDGTEVPYLIASKNYCGESTVALVRKDVFTEKCCFDYSAREEYAMSNIDVFLGTFFVDILPEKIRKSLLTASVTPEAKRKCFLLSESDIRDMECMQNSENRTASFNGTDTRTEYMLRTVSAWGVSAVNTNGELKYVPIDEKKSFRPVFVLPGDFEVINTAYNGKPAVKAGSMNCGIYIYLDGEWKGCI